jgi:hypothetical protein
MVATTKSASSTYMTRSIQLDRVQRIILLDPIVGYAAGIARNFHTLEEVGPLSGLTCGPAGNEIPHELNTGYRKNQSPAG